MNKNKTTFIKSYNSIIKWHFINAEGKVLGKVASEIARVLIGKNKPEYAPNVNAGDKIVVTNAEKIVVTGKKAKDKVYKWYTGFPGGVRTINFEDLMAKNPTEALRKAVKGMLPKNKLQEPRLKSLFIYPGSEHPHKAQEK